MSDLFAYCHEIQREYSSLPDALRSIHAQAREACGKNIFDELEKLPANSMLTIGMEKESHRDGDDIRDMVVHTWYIRVGRAPTPERVFIHDAPSGTKQSLRHAWKQFVADIKWRIRFRRMGE